MLGYIKIGAAVPKAKIADCEYNTEQILTCIKDAQKQDVKLLIFPELAVSCYTCGDMFLQRTLIEASEAAVAHILKKTKSTDMVIVIGAPVAENSSLYNCAIVMHLGKILGIVPKEFLPEHGVFNESRWFKRGSQNPHSTIRFCGEDVPFGTLLFKCNNYNHLIFAVEVCADVWSVVPPSSYLSLMGATVLFNISASPNYAGRRSLRRNVISSHSARCSCAYAYVSSSISESTADCVFDGHALIASEGQILAEGKAYSPENELVIQEVDLESIVIHRTKSSYFTEIPVYEDTTTVEFSFKGKDDKLPDVKYPQIPFAPTENEDEFYNDLLDILSSALYKRITHIGVKTAIIGVSGGLDSTLALLAAAKCYDKMGASRKGILGVTMPGFGTSGRTYNNAIDLMKELKISNREISIKDSCLQHFKDIGHDPSVTDTTFENAQARERTQILMDLANMENGIVVGTGDMSELALGWATFNGDHMSMYGVNAGMPKTIIRKLVGWIVERDYFGKGVSKVLADILDTPVSPELLPTDSKGKIAQKTEELVGSYELNDFFIYCVVGKGFSPRKTAFLAEQSFHGVYDRATILKWLRTFYSRFFSQQFKRSCSADGPQALAVTVSARGDLRMSSDICGTLWVKEVEAMMNEK